MAIVKFRDNFEIFTGNVDGIVFYPFYDKHCARLYKKPYDPGTDKQLVLRIRFAVAVHTWQVLPEKEKEYWRSRGRRRWRSGYNIFISYYMIYMHSDAVAVDQVKKNHGFAVTQGKDTTGTASERVLSPFVPASFGRIPECFNEDALLL